jgi:pimeloyl-ACP methyl ester carboxylesterase
VAVPTVAPAANAADACGLGETCTGALTGSLGDSAFQITMPPKFNGTVLLYSHGYRIAQPVPAQIATALRLDQAPYYSETTVPGIGPAYVGNGIAQVAPSAAAAANLLGQGYALAGTGYANQGWAVAEGVEAGENLIQHINSGAIEGVDEIIAWGDSMGGLITQTLVQDNPGKIAGSLPLCGAMEGPLQAFSSAMTVLYTWQQLIDPTLTVANYAPGQAGYSQAVGDLLKVFSTLSAVASGEATVSAAGFPIAQANLLAGLMAGLPTKSPEYDGVTTNPVVSEQGLGAAIAGGFSPLSAGANSTAAMLQNVGAAAALGIMGRYELEQRVRTIGGLAPTDNANFNNNVPVVYSKLLTPEQRAEFEGTFTAAGPGVLDAMLNKMDASVGSETARFPANPAAVAIVNGLPAAKGTYNKPAVFITTTYDPITPAGNQYEFFESMVDSKKAQRADDKGMLKAVEYFTDPLDLEYTKFEPGAKGPSATLSALATGGSGVGHCSFTTDQLVGAVGALSGLIDADTKKQVAAAKRTGYRVAGVNRDRLFAPPLLKQPLATAN